MSLDRPTREDRESSDVQDLLGSWFERTGRGETPDLDQHCAERPELRDRLARLLLRQAELVRAARGNSGATSPARANLSGEVVGEFALERLLGTGGMGQVYLARQESLGREVAVKVLHPGIARDPKTVLRFRREAELSAALDHENIAPVYATGDDHGLVWIAMKYIPGKSLDRLEAPLEPLRVARIGVALSRALHAAHTAGIVHRDVKPANVILQGDHPYLVDFGLARGFSDLGLTRTGAVAGTLPYLPPELLSGRGAAADPRCDLYALGATLHEMLSGSPPFWAEGTDALIRKILFQEPSPLRLLRTHRDLEVIVGRALEKDPNRRFASGEEMAQELERYLAREPIRSRPVGFAGRLLRRARRSPRTSILVSVSLLGISVLLALLLHEGARQRSLIRDRTEEARTLILERGDWVAGRRLLRDLERLGASTEEVFGLDRAARARESLDALLDQVQGPRENLDLPWLRRLIDEVTSLDPLLAASPRGLWAQCAALYLTNDLGASAHLSSGELRSDLPRAVVATEALLEGRSPRAAIVGLVSARPGRAEDAAEDHVMAAWALRQHGGEAGDAEAELRTALELDPKSYRAAMGMCYALSRRGNIVGARMALHGLHDHAAHQPLVHVSFAWLALMEGRTDEAKERLDAAEAALAELGWKRPWLPLAVLRLELLSRTSPSEDLKPRLEAAMMAWPEHAWFRMLAGQVALLQGDRTEARRRFEEVVGKSQMPWYRRAGLLSLLQLDVAELGFLREGDPERPLEEGERDRAKKLLKTAEQLWEEAREAGEEDQTSELLVVRFQLARRLRDLDAAWSYLERAAESDHTTALVAYGVEVAGLLGEVRRREVSAVPPMTLPEPLNDLLRRGQRRARSVWHQARRGMRAASPAQLVLASYSDVEISVTLGEREDLLSVIDFAASLRASAKGVNEGVFARLESLRPFCR